MKYLILICLAILTSNYIQAQKVMTSTLPELLSSNRALLPESAGGPMPDHRDLTDLFPRGGYQCSSNACVSFACAYTLYSYLYRRDNKLDFTYTDSGHVDKSRVFSPFFIFNSLKKPGDCPNNLTNILETLTFLGTNGTTPLNKFEADPCVDTYCDSTPSPDVNLLAKKYTIRNYAWIYSTLLTKADVIPSQALKRYLFINTPIVIIMDVNGDFENLTGKDENFVWQENYPLSQNLHALVCTGFDDKKNALRFVNSYGDNWGYKNSMWISYDVVNMHLREAFVVNCNQVLLVKGYIHLETDFRDSVTGSGNNYIFRMYDGDFKKVSDFLISGKALSPSRSVVTVIQKGADNLLYTSQVELGNTRNSLIALPQLKTNGTIKAYVQPNFSQLSDCYFDVKVPVNGSNL